MGSDPLLSVDRGLRWALFLSADVEYIEARFFIADHVEAISVRVDGNPLRLLDLPILAIFSVTKLRALYDFVLFPVIQEYPLGLVTYDPETLAALVVAEA